MHKTKMPTSQKPVANKEDTRKSPGL
jgi:hypothetical protein